MDYYQPQSGIHLLLQPADRNRTQLEFTYTSGGSWFEQPGDRGRRHLLEHCLVSRTKALLFEQVKDYCFQEDIELNAFTSSLPMSLVASGHKDDFGKILDLLTEFFLDPTFSEEDLNREKEIVLREISERKGDPSYMLYFDTLGQIFTPESLDNHQVLGSVEDVAKTTVADFRRMHTQVLAESHLIFKFSGGGFDSLETQAQILGKIQQLNPTQLQAIAQSKAYPIGYLPENKFKDFKNLPYVNSVGHEHAEVTVYIPCPADFDNRPIQAIFEQLYLKYGGILYDRLRDELGLVYGLSGSFRQTMQALEIELACEIRHVKKILGEIISTFNNFDKHFKPHKFEQMKNKVRKQKDMATDNPKFFVDFTEKRMLNYGIAEKYEDYSDKIENVSQEDIKLLYETIQRNLVNKKVVVVSKNPRIETDDIFI